MPTVAFKLRSGWKVGYIIKVNTFNYRKVCEIIDLIKYKEDREEKLQLEITKTMLIEKMSTEEIKEEAEYTFLEILDLFCHKYYPDIYRRFDLFIKGKLK